MDKQIVDYAKEFDESVDKYNKWLGSLENPKVQRKNYLKVFLKGVGSVLNIFGNSSDIRILKDNSSLYSGDVLSSGQKDAIATASDWQRVNKTLDKIILGESSNKDISVEEAKARKPFVQQMYNHFKDVYVSYAVK